MKKILLCATLGAVLLAGLIEDASARKGGYVRGYTKKDGTRVKGHYRRGTGSGSGGGYAGGSSSRRDAAPVNQAFLHDVYDGKYEDKAYVEPGIEIEKKIESIDGKCISVTDGDTISVLRDKQVIKIRLYGIDTPEQGQAFGEKAKQFSSSLVFSKTIRVYPKGKDRYGRTLGWVFVGKTCLNSELLKTGLAWWYKEFAPKETGLQQFETNARLTKSGLWKDENPVAPWNFRGGKESVNQE